LRYYVSVVLQSHMEDVGNSESKRVYISKQKLSDMKEALDKVEQFYSGDK